MRDRTRLRDLPLFLRAPRAAGLWLIGVLIPLATLAALILSYRGLFDWARVHGWPWYLAPLFPLLIDVLIVAGEVVLFAAAIDGNTPRRVRAAAWLIVLVFTALSVVGNVSHAATTDLLTRGGWGLPPVVLAVALGFGLGELKRQAAKYRETPGDVSLRSQLRPVPADILSAAKVSMAATVAAGNPLSRNQLQSRFNLTRAQADEIRSAALPERARGGPPIPAPAPGAQAGGRDGASTALGVPATATLNGDGPHG